MTDAGGTGNQGVVGTLALDIVTGSDSLRLDSDATATIHYVDGASDVLPLPFYSGGSTGPVNFTAGSTTHLATTIRSKQPIQNIEISLVSHPLKDLETNDSWTVREIRAAVSYGDGGAFECVLDRQGSTITDGAPLVVTPGGCTTGTLQLVILTGGDDLRSDSTASVTVSYQGGVTDERPLTKSFPAGSTVEVDLGLASDQPIESITFAMQSHPGTFESADNWAIQQVEALVSAGDAGMPMCIIDAYGKTITDNVVLTVHPGGCPSTSDGGAGDASSDASDDASDAAGD